jgi:hypothetical protein
MADDLRAALGKYGTTLNRVVLLLASAGGQVEEGDRVINEIKLRHQLITVVAHGKLCASMCIPIFLQGEDCLARYGGGDTSFHRRLVYRSKTSIGKIDRWAACSARRGSQRHHQQREVPMRLIALILSSGIALVSIPASASPASNTFGATSVSASTCPVDEGPAGCGG